MSQKIASLERLMLALAHGAARELQVLCVRQTEVAGDERALLDVLSLARASRVLDAFRALRSVLPAPGKRPRRFAQTPGLPPARLAHHGLH